MESKNQSLVKSWMCNDWRWDHHYEVQEINIGVIVKEANPIINLMQGLWPPQNCKQFNIANVRTEVAIKLQAIQYNCM